jgi:type I restriction enzyme S subunit
MPRVSHKIIGEYQIKLIPNESALLEEMSQFQNSELELDTKLQRSKSLQKSLQTKIAVRTCRSIEVN